MVGERIWSNHMTSSSDTALSASSCLSLNGASYLNAALHYVPSSDANVAFRKFGQGPVLLLIHGFPVHGFTWRNVIPELSRHYTCIVPDLAGLGETHWDKQTDFHFLAHARRMKQLIDSLGITQYCVLAQDTGATVARCLAETDSTRLLKLILIDTEIPGHRPPWIREYQVLTKLPGSNWGFRQLLRSRWMRRSGMGFGGLFEDLDLIDGEFYDQFVGPLISSAKRIEGLSHYLSGIDWKVVDAMKSRHAEISQPVLLVWGANDPVFPIGLARRMAEQFKNFWGFVEIAGARVMPHEEKPDEVVAATVDFLVAMPGRDVTLA
jgi:pimeloyl-ACP methyl ester carboxylesterase